MFENFFNTKQKDTHLIGRRIKMIFMDDPFPILPDQMGTIIGVDDINSYHVKWDDGRSLHVLPEDKFEIINLNES
jgi:hypothetical protein